MDRKVKYCKLVKLISKPVHFSPDVTVIKPFELKKSCVKRVWSCACVSIVRLMHMLNTNR